MIFSECVQRAYLYLGEAEKGSATFDPDDVTRLVGLEPTETWRRGDRHPRMPRRRQSSRWKHEPARQSTFFTEEVVTALLDVIEPCAAGIAEARETLHLRAGINVVIEMRGVRDPDDGGVILSTAAITYSAQTVRRLAQLDLYIDHDQYVFLPDQESLTRRA